MTTMYRVKTRTGYAGLTVTGNTFEYQDSETPSLIVDVHIFNTKEEAQQIANWFTGSKVVTKQTY